MLEIDSINKQRNCFRLRLQRSSREGIQFGFSREFGLVLVELIRVLNHVVSKDLLFSKIDMQSYIVANTKINSESYQLWEEKADLHHLALWIWKYFK